MSHGEIPTIPSSLDEVDIGPRWLTRFEMARILGSRTLQISMGAPVLVESPSDDPDVQVLAELELKAGILPVSIRRSRPNGAFQDIPLNWLLMDTQNVES